MYQEPNYYKDLSLRLSEVLSDIGLTERLVIKRRKEMLLAETIRTVSRSVLFNDTWYMFGSLSEGTTTLGLLSDTDNLHCDHMMNVIQDYSEWKRGYINLMMIKDVNTSPGYCLLQVLRPDHPLPSNDVVTKHYVKVDKDVVLFKNFLGIADETGKEMHGPAWTTQNRPNGLRDYDTVNAFQCKSWPKEARQWLLEDDHLNWPSEELKIFAENNGCFVVPVASRVSQNKEFEWRISTSLAERSLMFTLNITQLRCYVLMKMVLKTYLNNLNDGRLSSFMCKTVLLNCIKKAYSGIWVEANFLTCFTYYLQAVLTSILHDHCPHFIIPGNNLMALQFSAPVKLDLLQKIRLILKDIRNALTGIQVDDLGKRLQIKLNISPENVCTIKSASEISRVISGGVIDTITNVLHTCFEDFACELMDFGPEVIQPGIVKFLNTYRSLYRNGGIFERIAICLVASFMCSTFGTVIAAFNLQKNNRLSREATVWLNLGLNSDVASSKLKLASVLYSFGDLQGTETLLKQMEHLNWKAIEPICGCYVSRKWFGRQDYLEACDSKEMPKAIRQNTAFCVRFMRSEINCVPKELQYEMFRSIGDDFLYRDQLSDVWMDWAVIDSLPYLYFLQYKVYGRLHKYMDKYKALNKLVGTLEMNSLNLRHTETVLNLLGQCFEQEHIFPHAILCYIRSLQLRQKNNIAKKHICMLLSKLMNQHGV